MAIESDQWQLIFVSVQPHWLRRSVSASEVAKVAAEGGEGLPSPA